MKPYATDRIARLSPEERAALRAYALFYGPHRDTVIADVRRSTGAVPGAEAMFAVRQLGDAAHLEVAALLENEWPAFLAHLTERGEAYARAEVPFTTWFRLANLTRDRIFELLHASAPDPTALGLVTRGIHAFFDIGLEVLGRAYFVTERDRGRAALRASEQQLEHAQKMDALGQLASGVAHDFNNVLAVVQASACMLEDSLAESDERRYDATQIRLASERGSNLTRQLLVMSRNGAATPRPLQLDELVADFLPTLQRLLGHGITTEVVRAADVPSVVADPGQLEQVVMNLAVNARDAMGGTGRLVIETSVAELDADAAALHQLAPGRYVVLAVTDTGPGIDPEVQKRIFEPFFTTKEVGKGTGLGLSIAHGIIAQAQGSLDVYSERGHGTTFRIRLPSARGEVIAEIPRPAAAVRPLRPATILFVEQDRELRSIVARVLAVDGCTVLEAATGSEAREVCVTHDSAIDVAIVDVALADGRGDVLARALRELRPKLGVLLVSGFPAAALRPSGEISAPVLAKPFTPSQLRAAIASVQSNDPQQRVSEPVLQSRVLVADDDPQLRRMLVRLFRRAGFDVVDVDSGRDALAAIPTKRFDVIVSDIHMPGGDGLELLRAVRRIDLDIPVILMSGKPDVRTAATALEFGAFRYLSKPLDGAEMEKVVRHAARAHALARIRREAMAIGGGSAGTADRAGLEVRFEQALDKLWMAFQPIIEAKSGALFGVEALMRTKEPSLPSPPAIIDAAVKLDRMAVLSRHVRKLSAAALSARADIPSLFVNLHPSDLLDATLVDERAPLTQIASRVVLEVTERESLDTTSALTERLARLRELGFRIAVDDIGAGYSGLTSFTDLMPEIVKIDMSLVRSIHTNAIKQRTVAALCRLCHEMGTLVVGEGVETIAERDVLIGLGCDLLQGYLIAKPSAELPVSGRAWTT